MAKYFSFDNKILHIDKNNITYFNGICKYHDGTKVWYENGKWHRLDGPAYVDSNNRYTCYYLYGKICTKEQHALFSSLMRLKGLS